MDLDAFVSKGWQDHAGDPAAVFTRLPEGVPLVQTPAHAAALAGLIVHVAGEHLGRWGDGIALLERVRTHPACDPAAPEGRAVARSFAVLSRCAGDGAAEARWLGADASSSERVRVLATAASALAGQRRVRQAAADFVEALRLAGDGLPGGDPGNRALAVTANNLAVELEERPARTPEETALMLEAARAGRRFWALAGGWLQVERAEYRLAMSHLAAGQAARALEHAERCLAVVLENGADAVERVFAHEARARAKHALADATGARGARDEATAALGAVTDEGMRAQCAESLARLGRELA